MNRRELLAALALLAACAYPVTVRSQQRSREAAAKVAILDDAPETTRAELWLRSVSYTHLTLPTILRV